MTTVVLKFTGDSASFENTIAKVNASLSSVEAKLTAQNQVLQKTETGFKSLQTLVYSTEAAYTKIKEAVTKANADIILDGQVLENTTIKQKALKEATIKRVEASVLEAEASKRAAKNSAQEAEAILRLAAAKTALNNLPIKQTVIEARQKSDLVKYNTQVTEYPKLAQAKTDFIEEKKASLLRKADNQDTLTLASSKKLEEAARKLNAQATREENKTLAENSASLLKNQKLLAQAELAEIRLAKAKEQSSLIKPDKGLSPSHILAYSAAYMAAAYVITTFINTVKSIPAIGMKYQAAESAMLGVYKSQTLVNEQMLYLSRLAEEAGVKVDTLRKTYTSFTASALKGGFDIPQAQVQFSNYVKTGKALNLSDDDLQGMLTAIQQIISKGRIMSEELQGQLGEHIPAAVAIMAKSIKNADGTMGVTTSELRKMMEQGKLTSQQMQEFSDVLFNEFVKGYSKSITNLQAETNRFSNAWDDLAKNIFDKTEGILTSVVKMGTEIIKATDNIKDKNIEVTGLDGKDVAANRAGLFQDILRSIENSPSMHLAWLKQDLKDIKALASNIFPKSESFVNASMYEASIRNLENALTTAKQVAAKGSEEQKLVLQTQLSEALKIYTEMAINAYNASIHYQDLIAKKRANGISAKSDQNTLVSQLGAYNTVSEKITEIAALYNKVSTDLTAGRDKEAETIKAQAEEAKKAAEMEAKEAEAKKLLSSAQEEFNKAATKAVQITQKLQDYKKRLVETVTKNTFALQGNSTAIAYLEARLEGASKKEAELATKMGITTSLIAERDSIRQESEGLSGGIIDTIKAKFEITGTKEFNESLSKAEQSIDGLVLAQTEYNKSLENLQTLQGELLKQSETGTVAIVESYSAGTVAVEKLSAAMVKLHDLSGRAVNYDTTKYDTLIEKYAKLNNLSTNLVRSVMTQESRQNPKAVSSAGALGLMQVMPNTARGLGYSPNDALDPEKAIAMGTKLLGQLTVRFKGNIEKILAAYNAGEGAVTKYNGVPPYKETQNYVKQIINYKAQFDSLSTKSVKSEEALVATSEKQVSNTKALAIGVENIVDKYSKTKQEVKGVAGETSKTVVAAEKTNSLLETQAKKQSLVKEALAKFNAEGLEYKGTAEDIAKIEDIVATIISEKQVLETKKLIKAAKERQDQATLTAGAYREQELTLLQISDLQREIALNSERDATFAEEAKKLKNDLDNSLATTVKDKYKLALSDKILSNNQKEILAEKKLNNEYQKTLDTLNKEYDLLGETGEEQAKRKLALEGYLGTYGKEILLLQQKIALKQEEIELNDLAYTNSHTDKENYRYGLKSKNIPEDKKDYLATKYIDAKGAGVLKQLKETERELRLTGRAWSFAQVYAEKYSTTMENSIIAQMKVNEQLDEVKNLGNGISEVFKSTITDSLNGMLETGNKTLDALINKLIESIVQSNTFGGALDDVGLRLANLTSGSGGGFLSGLIGALGSLLKFADGGTFNINKNEIEQYADGGTFHNSIVKKPTFFKNGRNLAVAGEAGEEGIFPMTNGKILAITPKGKEEKLATTRIRGKLGVVLDTPTELYASGGVFGSRSSAPISGQAQQNNKTTSDGVVNVTIVNKGDPVTAEAKSQRMANGDINLTIMLEKIDDFMANGIQKKSSNTYEALQASFGR